MPIRQFESEKILGVMSKEFSLSRDIILRESLKGFLEKKLREIKTEIFKIAEKYKISSVEELEVLFKEGKIEEKNSLEDFQKLDHLEFKRDEIEKLLQDELK